MIKGRTSSKENTANLFNRYVWLVDTVYQAGKTTFEAINDKWSRSILNESGEDIPLRTFHNHRKAIEQMFDINIECDKKNGYVYYIENSDDLKRGGVRSWLMNTFAVNNLINESHKLKNRILFEHIPSGQQFLTPIIEAMRDNLTVEVVYQNYWHDKPHTFEVHPYCVKVFKQRWYVVGNSAKEEIRIYSLDRVQSLQITENKFALPKDFDGEEYFINSFGISNYGKAEFVAIKVFNGDKKNRYLESLPLHHSQEMIEQTKDYTVFRYYIKPTYDFRQELLSHGAEVEVISPLWFREEIIAIINEQKSNYGK
ncbi:WYL domain-containing protein [Porphyromonas pogonae]|uniref:helix-turn-helix transcriptional regulator n=1 Tax=Porphyromonas pogonae TaxID=867595 RepID=UPI002E78EF91|nr:WYL domain-containing protein [Porphyromonas pogonae]